MRRLFLVLLITACGERLRGIATEVQVDTRTLSFPATATGDTRTQPLALMNASRAPLRLHASAAAPFALELDLTVAGGASHALDVTFAPEAIGTFTGTLHLTGDATLDVELGGEGIAPAVCSDPSACRAAHRDPATNTCVEDNRPDGTACSGDNACIAGGSCIAGACIGTAVSCDDHDACTVDACEPVGGCAHFAATCAEPEDKCQVALCDPALGCTTAPAADGTACGPSDCTTARVCMSGTCRSLPVPDGYACGEETPCRAKGRCQANTCNQAPATRLNEAWHHDMPYDAQFRGVTDAAGNLYWVECDDVDRLAPCSLVSFTAAGFQRFRSGIAQLSSSQGSLHFASQGRVFVVSPQGGVEAFSDTTGLRLWSWTGTGNEEPVLAVADHRPQVHVYTASRGSRALHTLDAASGAALRTRSLGGRVTNMVLDAQDNLYFDVLDTERPLGVVVDGGAATASPGAAATFHHISLTPAGAVRYQLALSQPDEPQAVFNGELLQASGSLRKTLDGYPIASQSGWWNHWLPSPLMSVTSRYRWVQQGCCPSCDFGNIDCSDPVIDSIVLQGSKAGSGMVTFDWGALSTNDPPVSEAQLLSDGSSLFASETYSTHEIELRSVDSTGAQRFACGIDTSLFGGQPLRKMTGATALTQNRWAVLEQVECPFCVHGFAPTLRVYDVPKLDVAASGWTGRGGAPGRAGRPR